MADSVLNAISDSESENSERGTPPGEAGNTTQATEVQINTQIPFGLRSKELFIFRWTLRLLSLWCPTSACFAERIIYPALVNILLMIMIASDFNIMVHNEAWKSIDVYVFLAIDAGMYSSHLFGVFYFKSRDLEDNMLNVDLNVRHFSEFTKKLARLKLGVILSYLFLGVLVLLFFNTEVWLHGRFQCNSSFEFLKGFVNHFVCLLNYPTNILGVGNSLALSWTMCLFQQTCSARLQQLSQNYLSWTRSSEEAVYDHLTNYSRKVKTSCEHLKIWFVTHNLILIIAIPFLFIYIIKAFEVIRNNNAAAIFLDQGYMVCTVVIWVAPLYFAEQLQIHDEDLCTRVNEFCPGTIEEQEGDPDLRALPSNPINPIQECYTFRLRTEVKKFLSYLKNRKSGFLVGSYSFQLKMSMFSVFLAIVSFAGRIVG